MTKTDEKEKPTEIHHELLSLEALNGIIENFILREGTDYGLNEISYEKKHAQIHQLIHSGDIKIVFDHVSETVSLLNKIDFAKLMSRF